MLRVTRSPMAEEIDCRIPRHIAPRPPVDTGMTLETVRLLGLPIQHKGPEVIALPGQPLPAVGPKRWTNHIDLMLGLGGYTTPGAHAAAPRWGLPH
jgi:hypothetical protein